MPREGVVSWGWSRAAPLANLLPCLPERSDSRGPRPGIGITLTARLARLLGYDILSRERGRFKECVAIVEKVQAPSSRTSAKLCHDIHEEPANVARPGSRQPGGRRPIIGPRRWKTSTGCCAPSRSR
jgi:hypothetical protein